MTQSIISDLRVKSFAQEEIAAVGANKDLEILEMARALLDHVETHASPEQKTTY